MAKALYFVESIYSLPYGEGSVVLLFSADADGEDRAVVLSRFPQQLGMANHRGDIQEGWYVYFDEENRQSSFGYGNLSAYARRQFREFYSVREQLAARTINPESEEAAIPPCLLEEDVHVASYHVNVGHGNCSIIVAWKGNCRQIWMVDCSIIDKTDHWRNYQQNIEACLREIATRMGLQEDVPLHIDRFFLTHAHHDHYSGLEYLIRNHHIDDTTLCYINIYYQMASKAYIKTLKALANSNVKIIEPLAGHSNQVIRFLHPECRIFRSKATVRQTGGNYRVVGNPINNSSAVVMISLGGHSMVFPGDLEEKGFDAMSSAGTCSRWLFDSDYYVVSHHGSINGHPDRPCMMRPMANWGATPLQCAANRVNKVVLMGRDGAYSGIYSHAVVSYWDGRGALVKSEDASHFLVLEWETGKTVLY